MKTIGQFADRICVHVSLEGDAHYAKRDWTPKEPSKQPKSNNQHQQQNQESAHSGILPELMAAIMP